MNPPQKPYMPTPDEYVEALGGEPLHQDPLHPEPASAHQRPRRKKGKFKNFVIGLFLLVLLAGVGYAVFIALNVAKISTRPLQLSGLGADENGRTNILVLGVGDPGHAGEKLSDANMVISLDTKNKRVAQISMPRDMRVEIPGYGPGKINVAHAVGGVKLSQQTVSNTLDLPIHYYIKTNFSGLKQIVDAVGGVEVDVKERLKDPEYPCDDNPGKSCGLDIEPGKQHMDGAMALKYVRCRKGTCGNDFGRAERQQEIVNLVRDKAVKWDVLINPTKLTPIVTALRSGIETDMGAVEMLQFARIWEEAKAKEPVKLVLSTEQDGGLTGLLGTSDLIPVGGDYTEIQKRVAEIFDK